MRSRLYWVSSLLEKQTSKHSFGWLVVVLGDSPKKTRWCFCQTSDWHFTWLTDWIRRMSISWLIDWLIDWLIFWLVGCLIDYRISQIYPSCSRHKDRQAMLYCTSCDLLICCACSMTTTHCYHKCQEILEFAADRRQQLRDQISDVESYQRQVDDQIIRTRHASDKLIGKFDRPVVRHRPGMDFIQSS